MGINNDPMKLDDAEKQVFFKRQLEHVKRQTYDKKYRNLRAKMFVPVSTDTPSGAEFITWRSYSRVGIAKIIADYAHDFPRVDIYGEEKTSKVFSMGDRFGYSIKEIRRAQVAGLDLNTRRSNAARQGIEELQDRLAWFGDANYNIQGFINYPGITEATLTVGVGGNTWALKTPDEIVADITAIMSAVTVPTRGREVPDTIIVPRTQYNILKDTRMTDGDSTTILEYIVNTQRVDNPGFVLSAVDELHQAGAAATQKMMAYVRDPEHLVQEIPQMFEMFDADKKGMEYVVPCHAEFGGVTIFYPNSVAYMDGI